MSSVLSIAASGMLAAQKRLEVSASNVANVSSSGPLAGAPDHVRAAYAALRADQEETPGGGTTVKVSVDRPGTVPAFDPDAFYADANGMVAAPNVDLANEAVQQVVARYMFFANAAVARTDAQMQKSLLDIKT